MELPAGFMRSFTCWHNDKDVLIATIITIMFVVKLLGKTRFLENLREFLEVLCQSKQDNSFLSLINKR